MRASRRLCHDGRRTQVHRLRRRRRRATIFERRVDFRHDFFRVARGEGTRWAPSRVSRGAHCDDVGPRHAARLRRYGQIDEMFFITLCARLSATQMDRGESSRRGARRASRGSRGCLDQRRSVLGPRRRRQQRARALRVFDFRFGGDGMGRSERCISRTADRGRRHDVVRAEHARWYGGRRRRLWWIQRSVPKRDANLARAGRFPRARSPGER